MNTLKRCSHCLKRPAVYEYTDYISNDVGTVVVTAVCRKRNCNKKAREKVMREYDRRTI